MLCQSRHAAMLKILCDRKITTHSTDSMHCCEHVNKLQVSLLMPKYFFFITIMTGFEPLNVF